MLHTCMYNSISVQLNDRRSLVQLVCSWSLALRGDIEHFRVGGSSVEAHETVVDKILSFFSVIVDRHIRIARGHKQFQTDVSNLHA